MRFYGQSTDGMTYESVRLGHVKISLGFDIPNGFIRSVACTHFMREKASLKVDDTEILPPFGRLNDMWWHFHLKWTTLLPLN